ncbi:Mth938-like domain-containing protein [Pseudogemmobacter sonorensis]|uniref:Mth938-like domain-containing protein n=1 Tax=Pseudogemmobacter sonorensis TaxID=2989681 RepID=UPI003685AC56
MRQILVSWPEAMPVEGFGPGFFRIHGHLLRGPSLITPWDAGPWGGLEDWATPLELRGRIDVLILGLGDTIFHPPRPFRNALEAEGIGIEPMASPIACRSYNLLIGEGRRVALAVLPVS